MARTSLEEFVEAFEWESETQKKGFLAFVMYLRNEHMEKMSGMSPDDRLEYSMMVLACWFIQKDHESNEWYNERFGDISTKHENQILDLMRDNEKIGMELEELKSQVSKLLPR